MSEIDTKTMLETVEAIKGLKDLFSPSDPYLPVYSALGGAFVGAVAGIIPATILDWKKNRDKKKSVTLSLYSEIKANLEIYERRKYLSTFRDIVSLLESGSTETYLLKIEITDNRFPVYRSHVEKIGILDAELAVLVVRFYQLVDAIIQDVKPGGFLNTQVQGLDVYKEVLHLAETAINVGEQFLETVEKRYCVAK